jgi:hypothetical protein
VTSATTFRQCEDCHTRILTLKGVPALNWWPDPAGTVAVSVDDPRRARFLARDEEPGALEKPHRVHECGAVAEVTG